MTIKIKDREVTLKYSLRSLILYENIMNKSFTPSTMMDTIVFMFCVIMSSDKDVDLTFDEWLDMLDSNQQIMVDFADWLTKELNKDSMLSPSEEESEEDDKKKVKKS